MGSRFKTMRNFRRFGGEGVCAIVFPKTLSFNCRTNPLTGLLAYGIFNPRFSKYLNHFMPITNFLLAVLAGAITYFLAGWLVFEGLLGDYMQANTTQIEGFKKNEAESSMVLIFVSCAAYAMLMTLVFQYAPSMRTFKAGFVMGAMIGVLIAIMTNTYWYATSHFFNDFRPILADVVAASFTVGIMGGVVAWVLGRC